MQFWQQELFLFMVFGSGEKANSSSSRIGVAPSLVELGGSLIAHKKACTHDSPALVLLWYY